MRKFSVFQHFFPAENIATVSIFQSSMLKITLDCSYVYVCMDVHSNPVITNHLGEA